MASFCRFCKHALVTSLIDLGISPLSNSYLRPDALGSPEKSYPLHAWVCDNCFLVQLEAFESPDAIFGDYAYFSSYSDSWLRHVSDYADAITSRLGLNSEKLVVEIASNDGYSLQYFVRKNIPVLGIEPAANVAKFAKEKGVPTLVKFFGTETARELVTQGKQADLIIGNNVLAHVPDINDFVQGMQALLMPHGVITMEFPHFYHLFKQGLFDTIYHEHFSYLSLFTVEKIFSTFGLSVFDVEEVPTHGGSLRIYACHASQASSAMTENVSRIKKLEKNAKLDNTATYAAFEPAVLAIKRDVLSFLNNAKKNGKSVVGYGAPAKGNTFLNYCGIKTDLISYTVDRSPHKQGMFLPGSRIPIYHPDKIRETKPDFVLVLPWNLKDEIIGQMSFIRDWGAKFVVAVPKLEIVP